MPSPLVGRPFLKMNGLGNAILVVDLRGTDLAVTPDEARALAAAPPTRFDQLMALHEPRSAGTDAFVAIRNADGSPAGACGNGMRCVAHALLRGATRGACLPETAAGPLPCRRLGPWLYEVDMGAPRFAWDEIPLAEPFADTRTIELQVGPIDAPVLHSPSALSMGNPHAVFWVEDAGAHDLPRVGPLLENHPIFPDRANISLAQVLAPDRLRLRVWERGAGETLACGSAACAAAVAAHRKGFTGREVTVELPGGELRIAWRESDGHVLMTGPVELEHEGRLGAEVLAEAG